MATRYNQQAVLSWLGAKNSQAILSSRHMNHKANLATLSRMGTHHTSNLCMGTRRRNPSTFSSRIVTHYNKLTILSLGTLHLMQATLRRVGTHNKALLFFLAGIPRCWPSTGTTRGRPQGFRGQRTFPGW